MRAIGHIARSVLIEAVRRREIYAVVLAGVALIGLVMSMDFFQLDGLTKFYREIVLKVMSMATAVTVIVLASRQLPREFEARTIYPLLARPIQRSSFLVGKLLGVMLAALFCFALFMVIYVAGALYLGGVVPWGLFGQYVYLQVLMMLVLATLCFWLSMLLNLDAAITVGVLLYILASTVASMMSYLYDYMSAAGQCLLLVFNYALPQLILFDLSEKAVHGEVWTPLGASTMLALTAYGLAFSVVYFGMAALCFRRRAL
jgi:ABC-type transport system involved in multi-copper enzyme maturation permease subunit